MQVTDEMVRVAFEKWALESGEFTDMSKSAGGEIPRGRYLKPRVELAWQAWVASNKAALAAMWRPINEAPDDQEVLVCGYGTAGFYVTVAKKINCDWMLFVPDDDDFTAESSRHTHFMPLPSPPNISARSSAGSEQPPSKRQVAGSNPAECASSSPQKREG